MSDLFFSNAVPAASELRLIMATRYLPESTCGGGFFDVRVFGAEVKCIVGTQIRVPEYYHAHLCRFVWRHHLYMELQQRGASLQLAQNLRPMLQRCVFYMDGVVEGLLTTVRRNKDKVGFRSEFFNLYLVLEFHVGRHEYNTVDAWRVLHKDLILEYQNIDDIGEPYWSMMIY